MIKFARIWGVGSLVGIAGILIGFSGATPALAQDKPVEWKATCLCESGLNQQSITAIIEINDRNREAYGKQILGGGAELRATVTLVGGACTWPRGCGKTSSRKPKGDGTFISETVDNKTIQGTFRVRINGTGDIPRKTVDGKRMLDEERWKTAKVISITGLKQP
ncbi:MAG: hypothetical protein KF889_07855 [Alphaproteobacteria bacterium]|nr:hypothetical protein [Alphaproteobacteria bacterium]MCW5740733.1 hypothetical protein [Alphaproteobacteria bacterium]